MEATNIYYLIPARAGSKGLPFKNRKLLEYTLNTIPTSHKSKVVVSTDDTFIMDYCKTNKYNFIRRPERFATDNASTKSVIYDFINQKKLGYNDIVVTLYLTYPERTWDDIQKIVAYFITSRCNSLLCKKDVKSHPYLCMTEKPGNLGKQVIQHDLYRRQDYPNCFEISHYVSILKVSELNNLNNNLYNTHTHFYKIEDKIDVDTPKDLDKFKNNKPNLIKQEIKPRIIPSEPIKKIDAVQLNIDFDTKNKIEEIKQKYQENLESIKNNNLDFINLNIAITTITDDNFIIGTCVMLYSFIKNNTWFNGDIIILHDNKFTKKSYLLNNLNYKNIKFHEIPYLKYKNLNDKLIKLGMPSIYYNSTYRFELFNFTEYDKICFIDSDILILKDIKYAFINNNIPITATYDIQPNYNEQIIIKNKIQIQMGFFIINKKLINKTIYDKIFDFCLTFNNIPRLADQTLLNSFFENETIRLLNTNFNSLKRNYNDNIFNKFHNNNMPYIIHYVGKKPWQKNKKRGEELYINIEKYWLNYYNQFLNKKKIAVIIHLYYEDVWYNIESYLNNININFDLYISTNEDKKEFISKNISIKYPNVIIKYVPNIGADIGPFIEILNDIFKKNIKYDFILKLHTKKSITSSNNGKIWMDNLLQSLVGNDNIEKIFKYIDDNNTGIIGPEKYYMSMSSTDKIQGRNINADNMYKLAKKINLKNLELGFFAGTMFWINFDILQKYLNNTLTINDFNEKHIQDGTNAHAMERLFTCMVRDANKNIIKI